MVNWSNSRIVAWSDDVLWENGTSRRVSGGRFWLLQDDLLDNLRVILIFQEAQAFEAEDFGEEGLVDVAVGGFDIVAPRDTICF